MHLHSLMIMKIIPSIIMAHQRIITSSHHHFLPPPKILETGKTGKKIGRGKMAKDKKDLESVTDYVEEKTLDQDKMNAAMGAMAKMKISIRKRTIGKANVVFLSKATAIKFFKLKTHVTD